MEGDCRTQPDEMFQLREIRKAVLGYVQSDIKNLKRMEEVREVLDEEFGQVMENVSGLVNSITSIKLPKDAKTESQKFTELARMWGWAYANLEELEKMNIIKHGPTLAKIGYILLSDASEAVGAGSEWVTNDDQVHVYWEKAPKGQINMGITDNSHRKSESDDGPQKGYS